MNSKDINVKKEMNLGSKEYSFSKHLDLSKATLTKVCMEYYSKKMQFALIEINTKKSTKDLENYIKELRELRDSLRKKQNKKNQ